MFKELAYQTYAGIKKFFGDIVAYKHLQNNAPALFMGQSPEKGADGRKTFSLQMALHKEGLYPPAEKTLEECPINGLFENCVFEAVKSFKKNTPMRYWRKTAKWKRPAGSPARKP